MKKWTAVIILACAQFVMVLDSTVMNVSISKVVADLHTTVTALQAAITFYALTMAAFMLLGAKLGDKWGRRKAFIVGAIIYACGSLITGLSQNITQLFIGWSVIEGLGAVLVIPAIAALVADNYKGKDRVTAYAIIGGISGAAMAAGPLIGGFVTTYLSWRYVFFGEVVVMAIVLLFNSKITDLSKRVTAKIDIPSVILSAGGLVALVFGLLQSKTWGLIIPKGSMVVNGRSITPFGISMSIYFILIGLVTLYFFYARQQKLEAAKKNPLLKVSMLSIKHLRGGLATLFAQYLMIAAIFFVIPVYLQMTLGYDALQTGIKVFPLSISLILFSVIGTRLSKKQSPKKIIRIGQVILVFSTLLLLGSISADLKSRLFTAGMFFVGAALGLLASQIGNVNMSAVDASLTSEVGGAQGVFQNLGSSFGTAVVGSVMVIALTSSFVGNINSSSLPSNIKDYVQQHSTAGVAIVPASEVESYAVSQGASSQNAAEISAAYTSSQLQALRISLFALFAVALISIAASRNIPDEVTV
jgi:MFS family permease